MPQGVHPYVWRKRLGTVRGFARYLATLDPDSEIPPTDLLPGRQPRLVPHIYTPEEIVALMMAARSLLWPLRAATFETVIGLLASTGLRLREALALDRSDVDLEHGVLLVRGAKHNQQREVPLHPSATVSAPFASRRRSLLPTTTGGSPRSTFARRSRN
jgi:integrase